MAIRIPTGYKRVTVNSTINRFLYCHCPYCDQDILPLYKVQGTGGESYHVLQTRAKKDAIRAKAASASQTNVFLKDRALFNSINVDPNYAKVDQKVVCPHCGKVMPWSNRHKIRNYALGCLAYLLAAVMIGALYFHHSSAENMILLVPTVICAAICVQYLIGVFKTLQERKLPRLDHDPKPVYFNRENIEELKEEKYQKLLRANYSCPQCGAILNPNKSKCPNCEWEYESLDSDGAIAENRRSRNHQGLVCLCTAAVLMITGFWVGNQKITREAMERCN